MESKMIGTGTPVLGWQGAGQIAPTNISHRESNRSLADVAEIGKGNNGIFSDMSKNVKNYIRDVKGNLSSDAAGTLLQAGIEGFIGGVLGSIGGSLIAAVLPGPAGAFLYVAFRTGGAICGMLDGLRR